MSENTGSKMFFSFLTGTVIGAALALLFAPQSGEKTREQIKDFSGKLGNEVKDFSDKLGGEVREGVEKFSGRAKTFIDGAKDTISKKSKV
ncbi:MAG: YtxH domain-containing protein [Acidobacteria bacterium]|nr:YtxH domain-containing protein [Acidobacteriota bacterium]MBU4404064.1 YtxH domain-containing protein [Acidobacteriota bacterium]MCG2811218.1 YtxH domain-containing protein [Candidatus Aminicenantes bacterium]